MVQSLHWMVDDQQPPLKTTLQAEGFQALDEFKKSPTGRLMAIPKEDFTECFIKEKGCLDKCVKSQGHLACLKSLVRSQAGLVKAIMVAGSHNSKCKANLASCPAGHEMKTCKGGFYCEQCSQLTYQPNSNKYGDQCRLRRRCSRPFMQYKSHGSTIQDSDCACVPGYHFENEDQRACVPNPECEKGFGQGGYGICENCLAKNMYSDTVDRSQKCKPLKNCEKESRCTIKKSNGTFDNVCGPVMDDIVNCDNLTTEKPRNEEGSGAGIIAGAVVPLVIIVVILIYYFCFHRPRSRSNKKRPLTKEQLDSVLNRIIQNAEKDETYCRKALNTSMPVIERRIDRQIWSLAQELFRKHFQAGKYEVVVEKYKGSQPKLAVSGYLQEWRSWRGEKAESIADLFNCLKTCGREDIVYEIANQLHIEGETIEIPEKLSDKGDSLQKQKPSSMGALLRNVFPCIENKRRYIDEERSEKTETMNRLLDSEGELHHHPPQTTVLSSNPPVIAGEYRGPSPSAPVLEEVGVEKYSDQTYFQPKPESYPIQASS